MLERVGSGTASTSPRGTLRQNFNALIAGGIHDQLDGGFHRAVQDAAWNVPFFEKRRGDTAQLIAVLLDASEALRKASMLILPYAVASG